MIVAIGSKNPAKVHAVQTTLIHERLQFVTVSAESNVSSQPFSDEETILGARNRALNSFKKLNSLNLAFGLEGGVVETSIANDL
ncbi:DUF84 family protein [Bacillus sp. JCM 19034]|uniref:DUF84 family protein n=1 Tax=Bacillus sp. JCM 19034 TaxID=1481928 RepID=UPI000AACAEF1